MKVDMKQRNWYVGLVLAASCVVSLPSAVQSPLTEREARDKLVGYRGAVDGSIACFPTAVSRQPALTSIGPAPVDERCYALWRKTFESLTQKGYLARFRELNDQIAINSRDLSPKGKLFFHPLTHGSVYLCVRISSELDRGGIEIRSIEADAETGQVLVGFRGPTTEPFSVMWRNDLFSAACRGEVEEGVVVDYRTIQGHAHFRQSPNGWHVDKVLLGPHSPEG